MSLPVDNNDDDDDDDDDEDKNADSNAEQNNDNLQKWIHIQRTDYSGTTSQTPIVFDIV